MAAPTHAANVKKALANTEPSTHGTELSWTFATAYPLLAKADTYPQQDTMLGCPPRNRRTTAGSRLLISVHLPSGTAQAYAPAWG